jgi:hypothetical protein
LLKSVVFLLSEYVGKHYNIFSPLEHIFFSIKYFLYILFNYIKMAQALGTLAKWAIPLGLAVGGAQSAMYDGKV